MPELLDRSVDDMLAAMSADFGQTWPNRWWPKGNAAYDDCAACVSFFLFGLNSVGNPFYSYVSQIQAWGRARGVWHAGHAGVQRGDVLAFDWDGDGDPDHTEIVVAVSSGGSIVTSRGTNSNPGDDMRDRTRSAGYILSYIRPPYPGTTTAGGAGSTDIPTGDEFDMASLDDLKKIVDDALNTRLPATEARDRRETRYRVWRNNKTGNYMIGSYANGNYKLLGGTIAQQQSELASLSVNGYLMIDAGDVATPQGVADEIWRNIIAKFEEIKTNHPGTLTK